MGIRWRWGIFVGLFVLGGGFVKVALTERVWSRAESRMAATAQGGPAEVTVCFAPEIRCGWNVGRMIDGAATSIRVHAYTFTLGGGVAAALARAKQQRSVDVQVIVDRTTPCERGTAVPLLLAAGIPVFVDDRVKIAHEKAVIIDSHLTLAGSMNWSEQSETRNSEAINFIESKEVADRYLGHWQTRQVQSSRLVDVDQWCQFPHQGERE